MQITYQKRDGSVIQKYRKTAPPYKIGEKTSMGWKIISIKHEYKNKYYNEEEYYNIIKNASKKTAKNKQYIDVYISEFKRFIYYFIATILASFVKTLLGI